MGRTTDGEESERERGGREIERGREGGGEGRTTDGEESV